MSASGWSRGHAARLGFGEAQRGRAGASPGRGARRRRAQPTANGSRAGSAAPGDSATSTPAPAAGRAAADAREAGCVLFLWTFFDMTTAVALLSNVFDRPVVRRIGSRSRHRRQDRGDRGLRAASTDDGNGRRVAVIEGRFDGFGVAARQAVIAGQVDAAALPRVADLLATKAATRRRRLPDRGSADACGRPALEVTLPGVVPLTCQRCLQPFRWPVEQQTLLLLARDERELARLDEEDHEHEVRAGRRAARCGRRWSRTNCC